MRRLGLLGGMSWESTLPYYREINRYTRERRGDLHSAPLLLDSVDFADIARMQRVGDWDAAGALLATRAKVLQDGGAEALLLCTNTMHKVADVIGAAVEIPLLHIVDVTAAAIRAAGIDEVGLLATAFTMEQDFYRGRLERRHGIRVHVPDAPARAELHRIIYDELCQGEIRDTSREQFRRAISALVDRGARGIIFGCTEVGLLVDAGDSPVPEFDSCILHARAAVDWALQGAGDNA